MITICSIALSALCAAIAFKLNDFTYLATGEIQYGESMGEL